MAKKMRMMTEDERQELIKMCNANLPLIAILHNITYCKPVLLRYIRELEQKGLINYKPERAKNKSKSKQAIYDDYQAGLKDINMLALKHNKTAGTVYSYLLSCGVKKGRNGKRGSKTPMPKTAEIQSQLLMGKSQAEIARQYGVSRQWVCKIAKRIDKKILPKKVTVKQQIIDLLRQGKSAKEIALQLNITTSNVCRVKKDIDLQ